MIMGAAALKSGTKSLHSLDKNSLIISPQPIG
jgi:hypothetical protein